MGLFGWSYPPGCSGPPEEPELSAQAEEVWGWLEAAGVDEVVIEKVMTIITDLEIEAAAECPACMKRWAEEEKKAADDFDPLEE